MLLPYVDNQSGLAASLPGNFVPVPQQWPPPAVTPMPDNVAVMVSLEHIKSPIEKIVMLIVSNSLSSEYPQEEDSVREILYDCLNQYLAFTLPTLPQRQNITIEYYLEERFQPLLPYLSDPQLMMFINAQWAIAVSELGAQLLPGIRDLVDRGQEIDAVETFHGTRRGQSIYVLTGVHFEDMDGGELPPE